MKQSLVSLTALVALAACSTSPTLAADGGLDGGSVDAGFTNITFTTVDVHPAAKAAGLPGPDLNSGGYALVLNGVSINPADAANPIVITPLGQQIITSVSGPYVFPVYNVYAVAPLGILAAIHAVLPDGGSPQLGDGGLPQATCAQVAVALDGGGIAGLKEATAANDYYVPAGSQVGGLAQPPTGDVPNAAAYATPMSYAALLNCAGQATKTTFDTDQGVALTFVSNGASAAAGTPVSGVSFVVKNAGNAPPPTYYASNYTASSTMGGTDATGVATVVGVQTVSTPGTLGASDSASDQFFVPGIATQANAIFNVFVYKK